MSGAAGTDAYVFLSYTSPERERALAIADALEAAGIRVWVDRRDIVGGSSWDASIVDAITSCAVFVLTCSARSLASPNVQQEVRLAWEEQRPILPLLLERVTVPRELRYPLAGRQWVELLDRSEAAWLPDVLRALAGLGVEPAHRAPEEIAPGPAAERAGLPAPLTSFVGREREVADLMRLLREHRLVTITGPGGAGKTRTAIEAARAVLGDFADGVRFVDLAPVRDPALVPAAIAQALGIPETAGQPLAESLRIALRSQNILLVLDNFEQVVAAAPALGQVLERCPDVRALVTSRIVLRLRGEQEYPLAPLALPDDAATQPVSTLAESAAVGLFVERARQARPDFALSSENAAAVAAICRRLDGLPLGIELAAARLKILTPNALLERLQHSLAALGSGARDLPERQQTLHSAIAWSYELLTPAEQALLRRLAVFVGGFSIEAAESVANAAGALDLDALDGIASLADKSLVVPRPGPQGEPRFALLATVQEFAQEQLIAAGEELATRHAHTEFLIEFGERAEAELLSARRAPWMQRMDAEQGNVRAALDWTVEHAASELGARLLRAVSFWLSLRSHGELRSRAETLLGLLRGTESEFVHASVQFAVVCGAFGQGDREAMRRYGLDCARTLKRLGETRLAGLAFIIASAGDFKTWEEARAVAYEGLALIDEAGDAWLQYNERTRVAYVAALWNDLDTADVLLAESAAYFEKVADPWELGAAQIILGSVASRRGEHARRRAATASAPELDRDRRLGARGLCPC